MAEQDLQQQHVVPVSGHANLRLVEFWRDAPHAWFCATEAQFRLCNIVDDNIKYSLLLTALPRDAFCVVAHLVVDDPPADAYVQLKAALIASHVLSNYQWVEMLAKMEPLGSHRPSEMLTAISTFPLPRTVKDLQAFLGLFNFYRKFVPKAAASSRFLRTTGRCWAR
jgi:hypothetical protein